MNRRSLFRTLGAAALASGLSRVAPAGAGVFSDGFESGLLDIARLQWLGAFRVPAQNNGGIPGDSFFYCGDPVIAMGSAPGRLLMVGQDLGGTKEIRTAAELHMPALAMSEDVQDLPIAGYAQPFANLLDEVPVMPPGWNSDRVISGLYVDRQSGRLAVNVTRYYDAGSPPNAYTTLVLERADDLAHTAGKRGFFRMTGGARSSGWISEVPPEFRQALGASHLFGNSDGFSILSRASIGPSAFACDLANLTGTHPPVNGAQVEAQPLLDFPYDNPLTPIDRLGAPGQLWTYLSSAKFGFIVPGTRIYLALGTSGGHASGVSYMGGAGYQPNDPTDVGNHYWAFRVDDMIAVRNGELAPHALRPHAHGDVVMPFQGVRHVDRLCRIAGGCLDPDTGRLYVSLAGADRSQSEGSALPLVLAFSLEAHT